MMWQVTTFLKNNNNPKNIVAIIKKYTICNVQKEILALNNAFTFISLKDIPYP